MINKSNVIQTGLTFSGNQGVTNGIWNVLEYECNVSNDSGETAPSIENTPRENWLHTEMERELERIVFYQIKEQWALNIVVVPIKRYIWITYAIWVKLDQFSIKQHQNNLATTIAVITMKMT